MDVLTLEQRRKTMSAVKSKNTTPELVVRRLLHKAGYRFRLHRKDLPGQPDIVLPKYRTVIFVHGCFWHQHTECRAAARPVTRTDYWDAKLDRNKIRDAVNLSALQALGWTVIIVWECETKSESSLLQRLSLSLLA